MKQAIAFFIFIFLLSSCESKTNQVQETAKDSAQITDPRVMVADNDPRMRKAKEQALNNLHFFIEMLQNHGMDTTYMFSVKADFEENGKHEHMWVETDRFEKGKFYGTLGNMPQTVTAYQFDDSVTIPREAVEDWMIEVPGSDSIMGAYSVKALGQGDLLK